MIEHQFDTQLDTRFDTTSHLARLRELPTDELEHAYAQLDALRTVAQVHQLLVLSVLDERDVGRADGCVDTTAWVAATSRLTRATARAITETARQLPSLPAITSVAAEGVLSWDQLEPLAHVATPETDESWAAEAPGWSPAALARLARHPRAVTDDEARDRLRRRSLRWWWDQPHGMLRLNGRIPDADGAVVVKALERVAERQAGPDENGTWEPYESRVADALVTLASHRLADDADHDRACVVVHVPAEALAAGSDSTRAEIDDVAISNETARRLACDATWQLVAEDGEGRPIGLGRKTRTVPPWMVRQLRHRDRTCRFPGCDRTRALHAHHIRHWADHGPSDPDNLVMLCPHHHRYLHEHRWSIVGDPTHPHGLTFRRPDGRIFNRHGPPLDPDTRRRVLVPA